MTSPFRPMSSPMHVLPKNSQKTSPNIPAWDAQTRNKNTTTTKTGSPEPPWHCLKQQSITLQHPLSMPVQAVHFLSFPCPHPVSSTLGGWDLVSTENMYIVTTPPHLSDSPSTSGGSGKTSRGNTRATGWTSQVLAGGAPEHQRRVLTMGGRLVHKHLIVECDMGH